MRGVDARTKRGIDRASADAAAAEYARRIGALATPSGSAAGGLQIVRQEPIGPHFADFVCRERRLVVEVDGGQHAESAADVRREAAMRDLGYKTLRVWNNDVLGNIEGVLEMLRAELETAPHPVPLPAGGEREPS